ncbi:MAG: hypothetical protein PHF75_08240, partial [Gallionella sp.]|nr:hypothetical protein [Gallionella sp.]
MRMFPITTGLPTGKIGQASLTIHRIREIVVYEENTRTTGCGELCLPPARTSRLRQAASLRFIRSTVILLGIAVITGCANMKSHDVVATNVQAQVQTGTVASAIDELDKSASSDSERAGLLYNLERGELL